MAETFGSRLRRRRERQQVSLASIAEQTKIKLSLLEALERGDVSRWPVGIFRRAYIRAYARAVGLDPDVTVREFLALYPDPIEATEPAAEVAAGDAGQDGSRPPTRFGYFVGSAIRSLSGRREAAPDSPNPVRPPVVGAIGANGATLKALPPSDPDLLATAQLCTAFACADRTTDVQPLLKDAARILDAIGLIVWIWDRKADALRPAFCEGYPEEVLAHLRPVRADADNATAAAFRSEQTCTVDGGDQDNGALVVPMATSAGCVGVLAVEVQNGNEQSGPIRALVTILAAQLARWVDAAPQSRAAQRPRSMVNAPAPIEPSQKSSAM